MTFKNFKGDENTNGDYYDNIGGAIRNKGILNISNSTFENNSANYYGGAIYNDKELFIENSNLSCPIVPYQTYITTK